MLQKFKTTKRRTVQRVLHSQGKAEQTVHDPEYDLAVQRFFALEKQFHSILSKLKDSRKILERYAAIHAALGNYLAIPFSNPGFEPSHTHDAFRLASCLTKASDLVARSSALVLQEQAIDRLEDVLKTYFPLRRKLITDHAGLLMDVESYRRRIKALQEKGKEGNDVALMKLTRKLESTQVDYNTKHQELLADLIKFYNERFNHLNPVYAAFVATQVEYHGYIHENIQSFIMQEPDAGSFIESVRATMQDNIIHGAPKERPKTREKFFSRLHWSSNKNEHQLTSPNSQASPLPSTDQFSPPRSGGRDSITSLPFDVGSIFSDERSPQSARSAGTHQNGSRLSQTSLTGREGPTSAASSRGSFHGQTSPGFSDASSPYSHVINSNSHQTQSGYNRAPVSTTPPQAVTVDQLSPGSFAHNSPNNDEDGQTDGQQTPIETASAVSVGIPTIEHIDDVQQRNSPSANTSVDGNEDEDDGEYVVATFPFTGTDPDDLSFHKFDRIRVIEKIDEGWWRGELNGTVGLFPITYVQPYHAAK